MTTETETEKREDVETEKREDVVLDPEVVARLLPPYKVLLHNDDDNEMLHVVRALLRSVPRLTRIDATRIMIEAHLRGVALVIVCPRELAEFYREKLRSFGLIATIEAQ